ncbi:MAG: GNAT family N-acetyltransferase [Cyclobacteriaceae bacterium]
MEVRKATTEQDRQHAFQVRNVVFVQEQQVASEDEYDVYDETASHFIAYDNHQQACGTARWRKTHKGIKLERFAVLKSHRAQGVGAALLTAVLRDVQDAWGERIPHPHIYLHAQTPAVPFYEKFGFQKEGKEFEECDIKHFLMRKD